MPAKKTVSAKSLGMQKQARVDRNEKADKKLLASITDHGVLLPLRVRIIGGKLVVTVCRPVL
jgi:hypothetical protein